LHAPARHHAPVRIAVDTPVLLAAFVARGLGAEVPAEFFAPAAALDGLGALS
jgi:hypothetical protein